jgi:acid phosphatase (class A)
MATALCVVAPAALAETPRPSPAEGLQLDVPSLARATGRPPLPASPEASQDLAILVWLQRHRTPEMEANSWLSLERNPATFSRAVGVDISKSMPRLSAGIKSFIQPIDGVKDAIKDRLARRRPYVEHAQLQPCLPPETTASFPSGHSTWFRAAAELMANLMPERRDRLIAMGLHAGASRVVCGVHYPSDVEAGQRLGAAAAQQVMASPQWRAFRDDPALKQELEAVRQVTTGRLPMLVR